MAIVLHYLGRITKEVKGNLQDAMQFYIDGDKYQQMCPEELSARAFFHLRLGELLVAADRLDEAKDHIRESERFFCDIEFASSGRVQTALAWASIYDKEGNYLRAKGYIKDAKTDAHEKTFSRGELLCQVALFWLELRHYNVLAAIRIFFQAMAPWCSTELGRNGGIKLVWKYFLQVLFTPFKLFLHIPHNILGTATFNASVSYCTCPIHVQKNAEINNYSIR